MSDIASSREQSTIIFPYNDLDDAITIARGLHQGGGVPLSRDQLGAVLGMASGSGSFNTKLSTARIFGLMETVQGRYQLTPLGFNILDPSREKAARAEAFLNVPLYRKVYEEFRGKQLPPRPNGLEMALVNFGVSPKQRDKARQAFDRSARQAGFYHNGNEDRLIEPVVGTMNTSLPLTTGPTGQTHIVVGEQQAPAMQAPAGLHPSIIGMLEELPAPKSEWSKAEQADWLQALATMFRVIYKSNDPGTIRVTTGV